MTMSLKQKKIKIKPRIKLNDNIYNKHIATCKLLCKVYTHWLFMYQNRTRNWRPLHEAFCINLTHLVNLNKCD